MPSPTEIPADRPAYRVGRVPSAPLPREPPAVLGCRRSDLRKHRLPPTGLPAGRRVSSLLRFSWFLQFLALPPPLALALPARPSDVCQAFWNCRLQGYVKQ